MDIKKIGANIKKLRELKNFSRETIAEKIGMSLSGYSKVERGEITSLSMSRIQKISEALEVDFLQILNFDANKLLSSSNDSTIQDNTGAPDAYDRYKEKYIQKLEEEIRRLKNEDN